MVNRMLNAFGYTIRRIDTPMRTLERGLAVLATLVTPATIIDIGVADGTPELYRAFEGHPANYLLIQADPYYAEQVRKLARDLNGRMELCFCGASPGVVAFNQYKDHRKSSQLLSRWRAPEKQLTVEVKTLDSIVANSRFTGPYLIKIDVEGAEMDVLAGAQQALVNAHAVVVETSVGRRYKTEVDAFAAVVDFMRTAGFSVFDILSGANIRNTLGQVDLVFVRSEASFR